MKNRLLIILLLTNVFSFGKTDSTSEKSQSIIPMLTPYNFSIGTNFDLINKISVKDIYFNFSTLSPNLFSIKNMKFGIYSGVRRSFSQSYEDYFDNITQTDKSILDNQYYKFEYDIDKITELSLINTNFYFNPILTVLESEPRSETNFKLFLSLDLDAMKQRLIWNNTYDTINQKAIQIDQEEYNDIEVNKLPVTSFDNQMIYSIGIGFPFIIDKKNKFNYWKM